MLKTIQRYDYLFILFLFVLNITVLGFLTPNYNHLVHTISMLGYGKYQILLNLNFLLTSLFILSKYFQLRPLNQHPSIAIVRNVLIIIAVVFIFVTLFPTNPHNPDRYIISEIGPIARIHSLTIFALFLISPTGIFHLYRTFSQDTSFLPLAYPTLILGIICFLLTTIWIHSSLSGNLPGCLGLLQKIIVFILLVWFSLVFHKINSLLI